MKLRRVVKYGVSLLMPRGFCFFVSLCVGCRTIDSTRQREEVVEKKVVGSDVFVCKNVDVRAEAVQDKERYQISFSGVYNYTVERSRLSWDEVKGERYYSVAGVHKEYRLKNDLVMDLPYAVVAATLGNLTVAIDGLVSCVTGDFKSFRKGCAMIRGAYLCILPGISGVGDFAQVHFVSTNNVRSQVLDPRIVGCSYDPHLRVTVCSARGEVIVETNLLSTGWVDVSVCDAILRQTDSPFVSIRIQADKARIEGTNTFTFSYDLASIVDRKLAASPNPSSYAPAQFVLKAPKIESRRKDGRLEAGMEGVLALPVGNTGTGDGYKVVVDVLDATGDVQVSKSAETLILRAGKDGMANVPFSIPVRSQDGTSTVRLVATDALGRKSSPLTVEIPYVHRAMPKLMLTDAKLIRSSGTPDEYYVDIMIRNKGDGYAEKVGLSCDLDASHINLIQKTNLDEAIGPREWKTVRMAAKVPNVTVGQVLKLKLSASERFGVGDVTDEFEVVVPE